MWIAGLDPYSASFAKAGADILPRDAVVVAYPPNWWIISAGLGALKVRWAILSWKLLNLAGAGIAGLLFLRSAKRIQAAVSPWLSSLFLVCLFASDAMANGMRLGQTSVVVLLGLALLVDGLTAERSARQSFGLSLLLLKPQIGLLFLLLLLTRPRTRAAALVACAITVASCLPVLFTLGPAGTLASARNFFGDLAFYASLQLNWPIYMSGLPFLLASAGLRISPFLALLAAWLIAEVALRRRTNADPRRFAAEYWLVSVSALVAIVPLHFYDFVLFFPCLLLLPSLRSATSRNLLLFCAVLAWSANDLARALYLHSGGTLDAFWTATRFKSGLLTAGAMAALAAALRHLKDRSPTTAASSPEAATYRAA
ncbi:MAG TPA: glycosyltransferase 87 family protein, partial [Sphingomicrobium sp.]|nr:glycosyltransferase 87 family protein [Sphingomicrobium sp.]